jgi:hypothetical protein
VYNFVTCWFFYSVELMASDQTTGWRIFSRQLSATAYSVYFEQLSIYGGLLLTGNVANNHFPKVLSVAAVIILF